MDLAEKYGFIGHATGGTAILLTHKNQLKADGEEKYIYRQRNDLTIWEQANGFQMMLDLGETEECIAEKTGFSRTTVRHRLNIAKLDQKVLREKEKETLQTIAAITSPEFAKQAADVLDNRKHLYGLEVYLILLERLQRLISAGMPNCLALDVVQIGESVETLISVWRNEGRRELDIRTITTGKPR